MEPNAKRPRAPRLLLLWPAFSRRSRAPWATSCRPEGLGATLKPKRKSRFLVGRHGDLLGMTANTNGRNAPGLRDFFCCVERFRTSRGRPGLQAAGLKAAARRTHPSERVGHPQKQRKADPSVAFVDAQKLLMSMTFARRAPDGGLGMTANTNERETLNGLGRESLNF